MNSFTFHITLYDLIFLMMVTIGLTFVLLLWFSPKIDRLANRFLALALGTILLYLCRVFCIDIRLIGYLPLQCLLALGPFIYFYVLKIARPEYQLR